MNLAIAGGATVATIAAIGFALGSATLCAQELSRLAFMSGHWSAKTDKEEVQESWLGPRGEMMVGSNLTHRTDGRPSFEFLRIGVKNGKTIYFASPGGKPVVEFVAKEMAENSVVFENLGHDFPHRVIYRRVDGETLVARIEGTIQGKPRAEEWKFSRVVTR